MDSFHHKWKILGECVRSAFVRTSVFHAHHMLAQHSMRTCGPVILGKPSDVLVSDYTFDRTLNLHVLNGELLSQAALQTELLICKVVGIEPSTYIGRSQSLTFTLNPAVHRKQIDDRFTSPAANFWGLLRFRVDFYRSSRTDD